MLPFHLGLMPAIADSVLWSSRIRIRYRWKANEGERQDILTPGELLSTTQPLQGSRPASFGQPLSMTSPLRSSTCARSTSHIIHGDAENYSTLSLRTLLVSLTINLLSLVSRIPDGVRAGAKRLGRKKELSQEKKELYFLHSQKPRPYVVSNHPSLQH